MPTDLSPKRSNAVRRAAIKLSSTPPQVDREGRAGADRRRTGSTIAAVVLEPAS